MSYKINVYELFHKEPRTSQAETTWKAQAIVFNAFHTIDVSRYEIYKGKQLVISGTKYVPSAINEALAKFEENR